tara:strand:+ start:1882 stop:2550 length:669 start_codon:yes stop_codon:yes gene_type:complete
MLRLSVLILIATVSFGQNNKLIHINNKTYNIEEGDLFFQDLDSSPLCEAIEKVTKSVNKKNFSHVGICIIENSELYILEAFTNGVEIIKIDVFLKRSLNEYGYPKITIGRLKPKYKYLIKDALQKGKLLIGKDYDELFIIDNDKYYCSELIYDIFLNSDYNLFELEPMTFKEPDSEKFMQIWVDYFNKLSKKIPEGMLGINPGGISRSENINIIYDLEKNKN